MALKIKFFMDFVCPYCYLANEPFEAAIKDMEVEVEYIPYDLYPLGHGRREMEKGGDGSVSWQRVIFPLAAKNNMEIRYPKFTFMPYTYNAFQGMYFARGISPHMERAYVRRIYEAVYLHSEDIEDIQVLGEIAKDLGMDREAFEHAVSIQKYKSLHENYINYSYHQADIEVVPTFDIGEHRVMGVLSGQELKEALQAGSK